MSSGYIECDENTSVVEGHLDWCCETVLDGPLISLPSSSCKVVVAKLFKVTRDLITLFWVSFDTDWLSDGILPLSRFEGCTLFRLHPDTLGLAAVSADEEEDGSLQVFFDELKAMAVQFPFKFFPAKFVMQLSCSVVCGAVDFFLLLFTTNVFV